MSLSDELSPDIRRDLHRDAVRLNKQQLWFALVVVALVALAVPVSYVTDGYHFGRTLIAAGVMLAWVGHTVHEWWRLRKIDPYQYR